MIVSLLHLINWSVLGDFDSLIQRYWHAKYEHLAILSMKLKTLHYRCIVSPRSSPLTFPASDPDSFPVSQHRYNEVKCCDLLENYEVDTSVLAAPLAQKYHQLSSTARHAVGVLASMEPNTAAGMTSTARLLNDMNQPLDDVRVGGRRLDLPEVGGRRHDLPEVAGRRHDLPEVAGRRHDLADVAGRRHDLPEMGGRRHDLPEMGGGRRIEFTDMTGRRHDLPESGGLSFQRTPLRGSTGVLPSALPEEPRPRHSSSPASRLSPGTGMRPLLGRASSASQEGTLASALVPNGAAIDFQLRASLADLQPPPASLFWADPDPAFRTSFSISIGDGGGGGVSAFRAAPSPIRAALQWRCDARRRDSPTPAPAAGSPVSARRRLYAADPERGVTVVPCSRALVRANCAPPPLLSLDAGFAPQPELRLSRLVSAGALQAPTACRCQHGHQRDTQLRRAEPTALVHTGQMSPRSRRGRARAARRRRPTNPVCGGVRCRLVRRRAGR